MATWQKKKVAAVEDALRYAMSLAVCTTVSGIDRSTYCVRIARNSLGMTATERRKYEQIVSSSAQDGRFELYKTTADHDAEVGRKQHGYASPEGLAG